MEDGVGGGDEDAGEVFGAGGQVQGVVRERGGCGDDGAGGGCGCNVEGEEKEMDGVSCILEPSGLYPFPWSISGVVSLLIY